MEFPKDLRYTKDHEWARKQGDTVTVGITAFAVEQLGDITLVDLPAPGTEVAAGDSVGTIESVKSVSDIYSPVSGTISAINEALEDQPELVNASPYDQGWLFALEGAAGFDELLEQSAYVELAQSES